jgi:hypothetical protein
MLHLTWNTSSTKNLNPHINEPQKRIVFALTWNFHEPARYVVKAQFPDGFVLRYVMCTALLVHVWIWFLVVAFPIILVQTLARCVLFGVRLGIAWFSNFYLLIK